MKYATINDISYALGIIAKQTAFIKKKEAVLNQKMAELKQKFDIETAEAKTEIDLLNTDIEKYCMQNKSQFDNQRTMELTNGKIGFRINPPKVAQLNRKYTIAASIELIKTVFKGLYLRVKEDIDKDKVLADYSNKTLTDQQLAGVGLKVDQGETFFIVPDWEKFVDDKKSVLVR